jgi:hypothetical protein
MKSLFKKAIGFNLVLLFTVSLYGQSLDEDYRFALGLRAGETSGITFKFPIKNSANIELIAGFWYDWFNLTALYEKTANAFDVVGMNWYYGGGGHISFLTNDLRNDGRFYSRGEDYAIGLDGIVGLEYKIPPIPLAVSIDLKPLFEVYRNGDVYFGIDPGLGIKFTF